MFYFRNYIELFLTFLSFGVVWLFFPIIYDESYGSFCNNQLIGQFTDKPLMDLYYLAWVGFNEIYKLLHTLYPSINWGGIAFLMFNVLGLYLLLYTTRILLKQLNTHNLQIRLLQLFFCLVYLDNFISITHTRFSILYCGLALILLALQNSLQKKHTLIYTLIFIVGMLHRPESGVGLLFFIGVAIIIIQPKKMLSLFKRWFFPMASVLLLLGIFSIDWLLTDRFEKKIEPNIEYALTTKRIVGLEEMKTPEDSLRYQMANYGIFIDEDFVSIEFLKAITDVEFAFNTPKFMMSIKKVLAYWNYYLYFPMIFLLGILYLLCSKKRRLAFQFTLFNVFCLLLYAYIEYNTSISNRHLSIFLILQTLLNATIIFSFRSNKSFTLTFGLLTLLITSWLTAKNYSEKYVQEDSQIDCFNQIMQNVENHYEGRIIVVSLFNYRLLDKRFSLKNNPYEGNTYILYDLSYYSLVPPNQKYLASLCNCNPEDPVAFFTWLVEVNGLYISVDKRFELIEKYMQDIRKNPFVFYQEEYDKRLKVPSCTKNSGFGNYNLKQVRSLKKSLKK